MLALPFGLLIGLVVGTVGGGGAILALPVLVYVLDQRIGPATTESLIVVALAAAIACGATWRQHHVCWRIALLFALPAAAGAFLGALGNRSVPAQTLVLAFVPVMLTAGAATWLRAAQGPDDESAGCADVPVAPILVAGLVLGGLTGFFGVGGGFLIVPMLTIAFGIGMRRAVATSLAIIALTSAAALGSHLALSGAQFDVEVTGLMAVATVAGAVAGSSLRRGLDQDTLARSFAVLIVTIALLLTVDVLALGGPPGAG